MTESHRDIEEGNELSIITTKPKEEVTIEVRENQDYNDLTTFERTANPLYLAMESNDITRKTPLLSARV
jgi:hypothetical protein